MRQTVSQLSGHAATDRWIVTGGLYLAGILYLIAARGLTALNLPARTGLALAGIAALGVAWFPEPVHGTSGAHQLFTAIGAITLTVWPAVVARQPSVVAAIGRGRCVAAIVVSVVLFIWTAIETRHGTALGLAERLTGLQAFWPPIVAIALYRSRSQQEDGDGHVLAGSRERDTGVEDLVIAEYQGRRIGTATVVADRAAGVEQSARQDQGRGSNAGVNPDGRNRRTSNPAQRDVDAADDPLGRIHPQRANRDRGEGERP